jgi:hypothetical protein
VKAHAYIDGFNLYYGIRRRPRDKWLNLEALLDRLFPDDDVALIRYFTARVKGKIDPTAPAHQQAYLSALSSLPRVSVRFGKFNVNPTWLPLNMPSQWRVPVLRAEEKGSDVNLATYLLTDAFAKACEMAIIISNDSDLREPIKVVQQPPFNLTVWVVNPLTTPKTKMGADYHIDLRRADVAASHFPDRVRTSKGKWVVRPNSWT